MDVKLSVVIPTLGRDSLADTLASCADADEIIVVIDEARGKVAMPPFLPARSNVKYLRGSWGVTGGHAGRVEGIKLATGTHLAFMDDDDVYTPGAIALMKQAACDVPVIFRMNHYRHGILWRDRRVMFGNVSTQMYVVPNDPPRLGSWTPHIPGLPEPGGDYTFMAETVAQMGGPVWREEVTSVIRPKLHPPSISIVTPWFEHHELAEDYTAVVMAGQPDEIIIVDNGNAPEIPGARVVTPFENLGFAKGSNMGLATADGDAVLFLNNDVQLVRPNWLQEIREALEPGVLAGPLNRGRHADVDGEHLPYVDGWCFAGMREDLLELGGFDPRLAEPAYYSDNLLSLEARAAGMTLRDVRVGIRHLANRTAGPEWAAAVTAATDTNRALYEARVRELLSAVY
jgi:glycosyltransferase involved in cell wall biosynthesis